MSEIEKTADRLIFGYADEINGPGATEILGFVPTRHELIQLVEHWAGVRVGTIFKVFQTAVIGSTDMRKVSFAEERIRSIELLLGEEEVNRVIEQVDSEFGKKVDKRVWEIFLHGSKEQREAVALEFRLGRAELDNKEIKPII